MSSKPYVFVNHFEHREVEDFARRLNSDWPERMQELLSSGQERKTRLYSPNGNSFLRRNACMFFHYLSDYTYPFILCLLP